MADGQTIVLLYYCIVLGEKIHVAKKLQKIAQSLPGDDSTDTSAAAVLCHLYFYYCWHGDYFNAPQVYLEFGVKAGLNPFGRRPGKAGAIMIG